MLSVANREGLGPTAAAMLPCPWTYHLLREELGQSEHPLYGQWTSFYVSGLLEDSVAAWRSFVDRQAEHAGPEELEAMRQAFITSSRYEYMFWDAALPPRALARIAYETCRLQFPHPLEKVRVRACPRRSLPIRERAGVRASPRTPEVT